MRPYQDADREPVLQIWWESWHSSSGFEHPKPLRDWRDRWMLLVDQHRVVVAIDSKSESIVGFAALNVSESVLSQIFVSVDRKRKGIGSILFAWAKEVSRGPLIVRTLATNIESRRFYERLGMVEFGNSVNEFNGERVVGYILIAWTSDHQSE
ncbi:MAG: GNAT family N-acetyltransferase [Pseudomonadota bacterium]